MFSGRRTFHQTSVPGVVGPGAEVVAAADPLSPSSFSSCATTEYKKHLEAFLNNTECCPFCRHKRRQTDFVSQKNSSKLKLKGLKLSPVLCYSVSQHLQNYFVYNFILQYNWVHKTK